MIDILQETKARRRFSILRDKQQEALAALTAAANITHQHLVLELVLGLDLIQALLLKDTSNRTRNK
eukprot:5043515-Prorocentrum_lima.AAC.1